MFSVLNNEWLLKAKKKNIYQTTRLIYCTVKCWPVERKYMKKNIPKTILSILFHIAEKIKLVRTLICVKFLKKSLVFEIEASEV